MSTTTVVRNFFETKKTDRLHHLIAELDDLAELFGSHLGADFLTFFYRPHENENLTPTTLYCSGNAPENGLATLDHLCREWSKPECAIIHRLFSSDGGADGALDLLSTFATENGYRWVYVCPFVGMNGLHGVILTMWKENPPVSEATARKRCEHFGKIMFRWLVSSREMHEIDAFSMRLAKLIELLELPAGELTLDETFPKIASSFLRAFPSFGIELFTWDAATSSVTRGNVAAHATRDEALVDDIARKCSELFADAHAGVKHGSWADISEVIGDASKTVRLICASSDSDCQYAFGVWTLKSIRPTPVDFELLSLFGLIFQSLYNDYVLVKKLRASNKLLAETSAKMANVESLAAMSDMTSGVAHEFNNIFGAAIGRIQLMKAKGGDEKLVSDLSKIEKQLLEGAQTVRRIQQFTSSAKYKKPELVDVALIVRHCTDPSIATFTSIAESRNVAVEVSVGMGEAFIMGNQPDLAAAIDQVIANAVEHSPEGGKVLVSLSGDARQVKLEIADRGAGIPVANQKKVFYPFYSTKGTRGAGLGLAIVHGTVVRHDGRIYLQSEEGKGTTIHMAFRRADNTGDISEISKRGKKAHNLTILVVDDDEQIREVLSDMLSVDGHQISICTDGRSALKELTAKPYDMMITDLGMPGMSGLELAGRAHKEYPKLPIAMITGWGTQLNQEELATNGVKAILPKPFHLKDIKALVQELALGQG